MVTFAKVRRLKANLDKAKNDERRAVTKAKEATRKTSRQFKLWEAARIEFLGRKTRTTYHKSIH